MKRFIIGIGVVAALAFSAPAGAALATIGIGDSTYGPAVKRVARGTTVKWRNSTDDTHTVTSYKGPARFSATVSEGSSFQKRFRRKGTYKYRCTLHSVLHSDGSCDGMCGVLRVR